MTFLARMRYRLRGLWAGVLLGLTIKPIAGAEDDPPPEPKPDPTPKPDPEKKDPPEAKPPWGSDEEFDPAKAWKLIQDVRDDAKKAKAEREELRGKVKTHEDATKSDQQKLEERATRAESKAAAAETDAARLRVALRKGLTETQAKRLVGDNEEELEKDADELLESFRSENGGGDDKSRRPKERLRPGAAPSAETEETDPAKLAGQVPRW